MNRKDAIKYVHGSGLSLEACEAIIRALSGLGDEQALMRELDAVSYTQNGETLLRIVREHVCRGLDAPGIFDERDQLREALDTSRKYNAELNETIGMISDARDKLARQNKAEVSRANDALHALDEMRKDLNAANTRYAVEREALDETRKDLAAANAVGRTHALERARAETKCDELSRKLAGAQKAADELRATVDRVTSHRNAIESDRDKVGRKLYDKDCELNAIREQRNRLDSRVRELTNELSAARERVAAYAKQADDATDARDAAIEALAAGRARRQVDHAMRTPIDFFSTRDARDVDWRAALERERGFHRVTQDRANERLAALENARKDLSAVRALYAAECEAHEKTRTELGKERADRASMYKMLTDTCAKLKATRAELVEARAWYAAECEAHEGPLGRIGCEAADREIHTLRGALDMAQREREKLRASQWQPGPSVRALQTECARLTRARDTIAADLNLKCKLLADERLNHGFTRGELDGEKERSIKQADQLGRYRSVVHAARKLLKRGRACDSAFAELAGELDKVCE